MRWLVVLWLLYLSCGRIQATSLVLSQVPAEVGASDPFEVLVEFITSSKNATYYLAGMFYKTKGSNLFGLTEVDGQWAAASASPSSFFTITTSEEGSWSGKLRLKADIEDEGFEGEGMYWLRIDRFTGKSASPAESSNLVELKLLYTPPPTPTPTPQPTLEATAGESTPTPRPTPTATPQPTSQPTPAPSAKAKPSPSVKAATAAVMGIMDVNIASPASEVAIVAEAVPAKNNKTAPGLILMGSLILAGGIIPLALKLFPRVE